MVVLTDELVAEGMAREIVHRIQTMRRSADFEIADHIITWYQGDDYIRQVMEDENLGGYIRQETLSREINSASPPEDAFKESYKLDGHEISLAVKKAG